MSFVCSKKIGQKSSSHQYITKIQINGSGNVSSGVYNSGRSGGGGDKSFLSYQDAHSSSYHRAVSPASLQYSLTPISSRTAAPNKAGGGGSRGTTNVQYNEIELVVSVEISLFYQGSFIPSVVFFACLGHLLVLVQNLKSLIKSQINKLSLFLSLLLSILASHRVQC